MGRFVVLLAALGLILAFCLIASLRNAWPLVIWFGLVFAGLIVARLAPAVADRLRRG